MKIFKALFLLMFFNLQAQENQFFIGTYTDGDSEGIYSVNLDAKTGELSKLTLVAHSDNPSFIILSPDKQYLFAVNEIDGFNGENSGSLSSFKAMSNGGFGLVSRVSTQGAHPCHVALDPIHSKISVANYTGGNVAVFDLLDKGLIGPASQVFDQNLEGINAHAHQSRFIEGELYVTDLGRNSLFYYPKKGDEFLPGQELVHWDENIGPRHFDYQVDSERFFIISEYGNTISSFTKSEGISQTISTLDPGFSGDSFCADIHLYQNGNYVFGSNRGENSIVLFKNEEGRLSRVENFDVHGDWPRNFSIDPTGKWLIVANQRSHNISVFEITENAHLKFRSSLSIDSPSCIAF